MNTMMKTVALFLLLTRLLVHGQYCPTVNYDRPLRSSCLPGQSIHYIKSEPNRCNKGGRWDFGCQSNNCQDTRQCLSSYYANEFDKEFHHVCPEHYVIGEISSDQICYGDRRWKFQCCRNTCITTLCSWSVDFVNNFHWTVPDKHFLVGVQSSANDCQQGRKWRYKYCALRPKT